MHIQHKLYYDAYYGIIMWTTERSYFMNYFRDERFDMDIPDGWLCSPYAWRIDDVGVPSVISCWWTTTAENNCSWEAAQTSVTENRAWQKISVVKLLRSTDVEVFKTNAFFYLKAVWFLQRNFKLAQDGWQDTTSVYIVWHCLHAATA